MTTEARNYTDEAKKRRGGGRSDPPESKWGGREVGVEDIIDAGGDYRDWFTVDMRIKAWLQALGRHKRARATRRNLDTKEWDFGQSLVVGRMGANKSVLATYMCYKWYQKGHPVFSNGSLLFGRRLEGSELYDIVSLVPKCSVVFIDEAHGVFEGGAATTYGVRSWEILSAGLRKKNCKIIMASALAKKVAAGVRSECAEVWAPVKVKVTSDMPWTTKRPGHSDPRNFKVAWDVWDDYPFEGKDLTQPGGGRKTYGLGKPHHTRFAVGETVRNAFMLTDSFLPVDTAFAQKFAGKDAVTQARGGAEGKVNYDQFGEAHTKVLTTLLQLHSTGTAPEYIRATAIAGKIGLNNTTTGRLLSGLFGHVDGYFNNNKGYHLPTMIQTIYNEYDVE